MRRCCRIGRRNGGNPSSSYRFGAKLKGIIEAARGQVAELIGASSREVVFTSGATEANNTALHAALRANPARRHIVTSTVEHSSVLSCCRALEREGARVTYLPVDQDGVLKPADSDEPSHVVRAMKPESAASRQMVRFSLGIHNTREEIAAVLAALETSTRLLCGIA